MTSKQASNRENQLSEKIFAVATFGFAIIIVTSILFLFLNFSPRILVAINITAAAFTSYHTYRASLIQRRRLEELQKNQLTELQEWQGRWQQLLQETQDATSALVRMRDGVIMLGKGDQVLLINPAAKDLLGVSESVDMVGKIFSEIVRYPDLTRAIRVASSGEGSQKLKLEITDGDTIRPLKIRVDHFGSLSENHLLITIRDETESHRVDSMRREFVANISHELKTPLAAIKGYAETVELAIKDDPEAASHFMAQIHDQCLRLERLIADMMQLARAQAGTSFLNLIEISLIESIEESIKSLQHLAQSKKIELQFCKSDSNPMVRADPEALLTITNNLISNAIRYTPPGGSIKVYCRDAVKYWAMVVEDDGIGITPDDQKRIFERFYRVGKRSSTTDGGTGIGLSIVKNLVITLSGEIRLTSKPGEGASFEVLLPKPDEEAR